MEPMAAFPEGEWDFYSRIFSMEEPDFAAEILCHSASPLEHYGGSQSANPSVLYSNPEINVSTFAANESLFNCGNILNPNSHLTSLENTTNNNHSSTRVHIPTSFPKSHLSSDLNAAFSMPANSCMSMDYSILVEESTGLFSQLFTDISMGAIANLFDPQTGIGEKGNADHTLPDSRAEHKMKSHVPEPKNNSANNAKKRSRVASDVQKNKRKVKSNNSKLTPNGNDEDETDAGLEGQNLSSCSSEDDNVSQDSNGGASSESKASEALNSGGKTRASRGSATDPQSLYARKRRERINERLRILQNLVPNGAKVDISTMLEEAVHYVKFLQLQIKLLSSDDLWMFAPIAYNGIDIGLNQKISLHL